MKEVKSSDIFSSAGIARHDVKKAREKEGLLLLYRVGKDEEEVEVEFTAPNLANDILRLNISTQVGLIEAVLAYLPAVGDSVVIVDDQGGRSGKGGSRTARAIRMKPEGCAKFSLLLTR